MIKWEQLAFEGNPQYGVELQPIDFAAFAQSCGAAGLTVEDPHQVRDGLAAGLLHSRAGRRPSRDRSFRTPLPGKITTAQAWQFAKAMARGTEDRWALMKTVVENKIREVV